MTPEQMDTVEESLMKIFEKHARLAVVQNHELGASHAVAAAETARALKDIHSIQPKGQRHIRKTT